MNRKLDSLGRIVIPKEIREKLEINENTIINIKLEDEKIILEKDDYISLSKRVDNAIELLKDSQHNDEVIKVLKGENL